MQRCTFAQRVTNILYYFDYIIMCSKTKQIMCESIHRISVCNFNAMAKTLVNKMGLNT